jgi:hypothetical protein
MKRRPIKLIIFCKIGDGIQVYLMSDRSGQQIVTLTTIWWWRKLRRDWQCVNKQRTELERFNLQKLNKVECKEQYHVEI